MANPYKVSTKSKILNYLRYKGWTSGTQLEDQSKMWHTKPSVISRRARELEQEGKIEKMLGWKRTVQYRLPQQSMGADQANQYLEKLKLEEEQGRQVQLV